MRTSVLAAFAALALLAPKARADDTKPPSISDVKASAKGGQVHVEARITDETGVLSAIVHHRGSSGKVEDTPMQKNDFDDVFKASFPGTGDTEYWIESSDLLGNGPATYGSASKAFTANGKPAKGGGAAVATKEAPPPKREEPPPAKEEPAPAPEHHERHHGSHTAKAAEPPVIEHRQSSAQPPEGREFTVRMKIKSNEPIPVAVLMFRPKGEAAFTNVALTHGEGESYEGVIPADKAKGTLEYFIAAKGASGQASRAGNGSPTTPYTLTFKPSAAAASASAAGSGPFQFSHLPLFRVSPGKPILVRAQIVPTDDSGALPGQVMVLWRGNDGQDQSTAMKTDETGGYGGYKAELSPQDEGGVYYQIVACDAGGAHCGDDTGSKHKWHAAAVSSQPGGAQPLPIDAVSSKAPPTLPE